MGDVVDIRAPAGPSMLARMRRERQSASGTAYHGVAAALGFPDCAFVVVAPDLESLRKAFGHMTVLPLDESAAYEVAMFSRSATK